MGKDRMVAPNDLHDYMVVWEVDYYDAEKIFFVHELNVAEDVDALLDDLGENIMEHEPEIETPTGLGDFNIEYIKILDNNNKEVWKDEYYDFTEYEKEQLK